MTIKCLLVDDEPQASKVLQAYISQLDGVEVVGVCKNALQAYDILLTTQVDLIFLDVKMPKILGTDFLKGLSNPPKVIFVTAYRDFALDGFELDAVDFLIKPVSFERFVKAMNKVRLSMGKEVSLSRSENAPPGRPFVYFRVDKMMKKFYLDEILFVESVKDYVRIFLLNGQFFLVKHAISSVQHILSAHQFMRVHRSFLVSLSALTGFTHTYVQAGNREIPIGRLYKQKLFESLHAMGVPGPKN